MRAATLLLSIALTTAALAAQTPAAPSTQSTWQGDLDRRHADLIAKNGPGTDPTLRDHLLALAAKDQNARGLSHAQTRSPNGTPDHIGRATNLPEIDQALTTDLKAIVDAHGWPTIALVGLPASDAAMLLLTHTPDHAWQRALLPQLEDLADQGKIDGAPLAMVVDKELLSEGRLQRYGTQFRHVGNEIALVGVEDPANLDRTRARLLLPPMDVYEQQLIGIYGMPVSKKIVSPTAPPE